MQHSRCAIPQFPVKLLSPLILLKNQDKVSFPIKLESFT